MNIRKYLREFIGNIVLVLNRRGTAVIKGS